MADEGVQPTTIQSITMAHEPGGAIAKPYALLAGLKLDLFTALGDGPKTVEELAEAVGGDARRLRGLLYYLASIGLLTVSDGRFANTAEADRYLVRGRPGPYVDSAELWSDLWHAQSQTAESIRAGHALADHDYTSMPRDRLLHVYRALDHNARATGDRVADRFDFAAHRTLADVGGGSGGLAVALTERYSHLRATVVDLPSTIPVTEEFLAAAAASERVRTLRLDLRAAPLPPGFDVAVLRFFLQVLDPDEARRALANIGAGVCPGGALYVIGSMLRETRLAPPWAVWFNYSAIGFYERGQAHTEGELRRWLDEAGFPDPEFIWDESSPVQIVAYKRT